MPAAKRDARAEGAHEGAGEATRSVAGEATVRVEPGVVDITEVPRGGFGKCPCGQPVHNFSEFLEREILIESYRKPQDFTLPVVIINFKLGDETHSAYTFSKVVQRQLEEASEILAKGKLIRAKPHKVKRGAQSYLTLV